ncbi:hypothetical protein CES85_3601 (plasmid) [Ochrobactrum quorumnocens]|uniref:Uncharacterized protein n=1 Tax=Ochrobactrum quorumnocens TaxID=271865 RepID=A0A248UP65_9HYPH|nr:hypothetical protein [[Ochrobactrum] quorumnocens]ASV88488.1 hypothetical protein CES85_3601 [[Ochrobactrum] quorumnocens]
MIASDDKRFDFIRGIGVYEVAGGTVKRDLFDSDRGGYATDAALLEKLIAQKFAKITDQVKAEVWKWIECSEQAPEGFHRMKRFYPEEVFLSAEDQESLEAAQAEYDEQADAKLETLQNQIDTLTVKTEAFSAEALETSGAYVWMDYYSRARIERGFVNAETEADYEGMK